VVRLQRMTFQNAKLFIITISQRIRKGRRSCQLARERNELLLKTYAMWLADPQAALELFETREQFHAGRLALFEQIQASIEQESQGGPRPDEPLFGDYATVRRGVAYEREYMTWCRWVIQQLEQTLTNHCQDCQ